MLWKKLLMAPPGVSSISTANLLNWNADTPPERVVSALDTDGYGKIMVVSSAEGDVKFSDDYGGTWTNKTRIPVPTSTSFNHVSCLRYSPRGYWLALEYGYQNTNLYVSGDDGDTWSAVSTPTADGWSFSWGFGIDSNGDLIYCGMGLSNTGYLNKYNPEADTATTSPGFDALEYWPNAVEVGGTYYFIEETCDLIISSTSSMSDISPPNTYAVDNAGPSVSQRMSWNTQWDSDGATAVQFSGAVSGQTSLAISRLASGTAIPSDGSAITLPTSTIHYPFPVDAGEIRYGNSTWLAIALLSSDRSVAKLRTSTGGASWSRNDKTMTLSATPRSDLSNPWRQHRAQIRYIGNDYWAVCYVENSTNNIVIDRFSL